MPHYPNRHHSRAKFRSRRLTALAVLAMALSVVASLAVTAPAQADSLYEFDKVGTKNSMQAALKRIGDVPADRINNSPSSAGYDRERQFETLNGKHRTWQKPTKQYGWDQKYVSELPKSCDTRDAVMIAYADKLNLNADFTKKCKLAGQWTDHYGAYKDNDRHDLGIKPLLVSDNPSKFDIEHIVALGDVYRSGGKDWDQEKRVSVANDPINLVPSDPAANRYKSDMSPADYQPPADFKCTYAERYIMVKEHYKMTYRQKDVDALKKTLENCV